MPEISANSAPVQSAAPPTRQSDTPVENEDSYNNQPFDGVLQRRLSDKPEARRADEPSAPSTGETAAAPVLAADGKELPPDIAALIAASQPVLAAQPAVVSTTDAPPDATPDTVGIEAGIALARAPLPAALAALRINNPDVMLDARSTADTKMAAAAKDSTSGLASKSFVTGSGEATPWPGLGALLSEGASPKPSQPGTSALVEAAPAKDIALLLADARSVTSPTPSTTSLVAATGTTPLTTTPPAVPSTPLPFAQPGWEQGLGNRVMWMVNQQVQTAELRMNPAHLGPLEVRISIRDDQATVSFVSAHGQVREALQAAIPQLREMLNNNGLNLADVNIAQHSFADTRQRPGDPQSQSSRGQGETASGESHGETLALVGRLGLIDDYA
jgi:flagellar hook-length control protein FliK